MTNAMKSGGLVINAVLLVIVSGIKYEGDLCTGPEFEGECTRLDKCQYALDLFKKNRAPVTCGFKGKTPLVCCPLPSQLELKKQEEYGKKSVEMCKSYYRVPKRNQLDDLISRGLYAGEQTEPREFPHMALLGYGDANDTQWLCGGSLISKNFVLTAAHCLDHAPLGPVKTVRLGELDLNTNEEQDKSIDFGISKVVPHPDYKLPSHYNDIALIQLDRPVKFTENIKPICLHKNPSLPEVKLIGTGWGQTGTFADQSSHLLKVEIEEIDFQLCQKAYKGISKRKLLNGIVDQTQICAGAESGEDACPGDSGGPLQFKRYKSKSLFTHYMLVGITSFGKSCGFENSVGVYTRVSAFLPWIESIVWP